MVDGVPDGAPPVKRKRGRPRKADQLAAAAAAAATADGGIVSAVNGVPATSTVLGAPVVKPEPKPRKARKKKGEVSGPIGVDMSLVGKTVTGVLDGCFDAGYLLSIRVGDSDTVLRGVVFGPGLVLPLSKTNDVAPGVKVVKRDENIILPASTTVPVATAPGSTPAIIPPLPLNPAPPASGAPVPQVVSTAVGKPPSSAGSLPPVVLADPNSQFSSGQESVLLHPPAVSQAQSTPIT